MCHETFDPNLFAIRPLINRRKYVLTNERISPDCSFNKEQPEACKVFESDSAVRYVQYTVEPDSIGGKHVTLTVEIFVINFNSERMREGKKLINLLLLN